MHLGAFQQVMLDIFPPTAAVWTNPGETIERGGCVVWRPIRTNSEHSVP